MMMLMILMTHMIMTIIMMKNEKIRCASSNNTPCQAVLVSIFRQNKLTRRCYEHIFSTIRTHFILCAVVYNRYEFELFDELKLFQRMTDGMCA